MSIVSLIGRIYSFFIDIAQTVLLAAAVFLVIYLFLFRPYQVSGESMYPNFEDKEYVLTNLIALHLGSITLGDVLVFKAPIDIEKDFIKRVIGVPGDTVGLKDGDVYLNHQKLNESAYLASSVKTYGGSFLQDGKEVVVPQDSYFVLGDNREHSSDSREWGYVPRKDVIGESFFVYWPINHTRFVKNPYH